MLDRHAVHELLRAGRATEEVARQFGVSQRTIQRIAREPAVETADDAVARQARVRALLAEDPEAPPLEILRQVREEGTPLGESTFYRLLQREPAQVPVAVMVRFEGVAGEFARFDFGHVDVRLFSGKRTRVHFAAYRLKYSRWVSVGLVPDERVEALLRALLVAFEASAGVPLCVVFDRPKTVVVGKDEHRRPIWNPTLAQAAIAYGFTIELCAPSPEQKGSVENLVGFVKRRFFRARRFHDVTDDLPQQLAEWLVVTNEERPSRATGVAPVARLGAEQARMRVVRIPPAEYGLRYPVHVGPTALVTFQGIRYAMPAGACGIPATLFLYPDRVPD
jgi:transposase